MKCQGCGEEAELCGGEFCEECHDRPGSVSWRDCITGTDNARAMLKLGHSREEVLKLYPEADLGDA